MTSGLNKLASPLLVFNHGPVVEADMVSQCNTVFVANGQSNGNPIFLNAIRKGIFAQK